MHPAVPGAACLRAATGRGAALAAGVQRWLEKKYPTIAAQAKVKGPAVAWIDQYKLRSDIAPPGRS